jgi:c-di-GMP-binding flagellar brake protein YcgR
VAFRRGHRKCLCSCVVSEAAAPVGPGAAAQSLALRWPKDIQVLQRRDYHRVPLPHNMEIKVLVWPGALGDKPENPGQDRSSLYAAIVDISVGGMAVHLPAHEECPLNEGQTVSCEFAVPEGGRIFLEAHFRHVTRKPSGEHLLGFQFVGLEHGPQGRRRLRQLVELTHQLTHRNKPPFRRGLPRHRESV